MSDGQQRASQRVVGAIWKPQAGSTALGSGSVTINGLKQRFVILKNDRKQAGSNAPDYLLKSADEPTVDEYAQRASSGSASSRPPASTSAPQPPQRRAAEPARSFVDEDIPF